MSCEKVINLVMSLTVGFMIILVYSNEEKRKFKKGGGGTLGGYVELAATLSTGTCCSAAAHTDNHD